MSERCSIRLHREAAKGRIPGAILRELLDVLVEGVGQSLRLRTEGRSRAPGTPPAWLEQAAAFDLDTTQITGDTVPLIAMTLADAAPERFRQGDLFVPIDPATSTALDVFSEALHDALGGVPDSERYDEGLLQTLGTFRRVLRYVDSIDIINGQTHRIDSTRIAALESLERRIPPPQRTLVAGKLDLLHHTGRAFVLVVDEGTPMRGVFTGPNEAFERLGHLWRQDVVVAGVVKFRPSGRPLRLEAEEIRTARTGEVAVLSLPPQPLFPALDERALRVAQGPRSGASAVFGQWPGDESDEEVERALRTLS